jgi:hypothetical protein
VEIAAHEQRPQRDEPRNEFELASTSASVMKDQRIDDELLQKSDSLISDRAASIGDPLSDKG